MKRLHILGIIGLLVLSLIGAACITEQPPVKENTTVGILYSNFGSMPTLLVSKEIDGYIAWQPFVEIAPMTGFGKVLAYTGDFAWKHHPCCTLVATDELYNRNPKVVNAITALTILSTKYINENPVESGDIVADWIAGKSNFTYGNISVSSVEAMERAIKTVEFANTPSDEWQSGILRFMYIQRELNALKGPLVNATDADARALLFNMGPYQNATNMIKSGMIITPPKEQKQLGIGYLMSDHHTALFVAVKKWQYFNDTYGITLKPKDPSQTKPEVVELIVNGEKIADIQLIPADFGGKLMQLVATDAMQFALVGNPPAIASIDGGTKAKILMPINYEGSGVVVSIDSPAHDMPSFVQWAKDRSAAGKPLKIADPGKGSIQDILLRYAMQTNNITVTEVKT